VKRNQSRVSIVLPFYCAGRYLAEAIESILNQEGYSDWHLFLVNDGSEKPDVAIAKEFCSAFPERIVLLEHPDRQRHGISASRNLAISRAQSEFIAFLDADDSWYRHKLRSQIAALDRHPEAGMIYGPALRWRSWNGGSDVFVPASVDGFGSDCLVPGSALLATFLRDEALTPCIGSVIIRRATLLSVGCFEQQFWGLYDDQVLYAKLCDRARIWVSSDCVSRYRKHAQSCCGQAEALGSGLEMRAQFLDWLNQYQQKQQDEAANRLPLLER